MRATVKVDQVTHIVALYHLEINLIMEENKLRVKIIDLNNLKILHYNQVPLDNHTKTQIYLVLKEIVKLSKNQLLEINKSKQDIQILMQDPML